MGSRTTLTLASMAAVPASVVDQVAPGGAWVELSSSAADAISQADARWQALMVIAAAWRARKSTGTLICGGTLIVSADPRSSISGGGGISQPIRTTDTSDMYLDGDGQPSGLTIDRAQFTAMVTAAATRSGVSITSIEFFSLAGTVAVVKGVVHDPVAFVEKYPATQPLLDGIDPFAAEGMAVTLTDDSGQVVKMSRFQSGFRGGEGGVGPGYQKYVPPGSDPLGSVVATNGAAASR